LEVFVKRKNEYLTKTISRHGEVGFVVRRVVKGCVGEKRGGESTSKSHLIVVQDGRNRRRCERLGRGRKKVVEVGRQERLRSCGGDCRGKGRRARGTRAGGSAPPDKLEHWASTKNPRTN
jgi:hypothetical protein